MADLVHARYLGGTRVVMPDLAGRKRCCEKENQRPDDPSARPNPKVLVETGDVILLDRYSAEGRSDFEVVAPEHKPRAKAARGEEES